MLKEQQARQTPAGIITPDPIEYPESDGEPMAETEFHLVQMIDGLIHPLKERYHDRPDVYIGANMFMYYEEGNPRAAVAPDVFVVFGVPKEMRRTYKVWEEGKAPDVIFEITSRKTAGVDYADKRFLYEELGVREYFLVDPLQEYLHPPLQGFRREDSLFKPLFPAKLSGELWELESEVLGLILQVRGETLRLYDPQQERYLLMRDEEARARRKAEETARRERQARLASEAKLREAEAELARLRAQYGMDDEEN